MSIDTLIAKKQGQTEGQAMGDVPAVGGIDALIASKQVGQVEARPPLAEHIERMVLGEPIEDWLPTDQAELAGDIFNSFDKPQDERERMSSAILLADLFEADIDTMRTMQPAMMKNIYGDELERISKRFAANPMEGGFFEKSIESLRRGDAAAVNDQAIYSAVFEGVGSEHVALADRKRLQSFEEVRPIEGNKVSELFYASSRIVPAMARGYWDAVPTAFEGMVIGAGAGLVLGQLGPQALTLADEPGLISKGAMTGTKIGFSVGSMVYWYKQGAGSMYANMIDKGHDPEVAKQVAGIAAIPYAIVEHSQVSKLIPGGRKNAEAIAAKVMIDVFKAAAIKYGKTWTEEVFEEVVQEMIAITAEKISGSLSDVAQQESVKDFILENSQRLWETTKGAAQAMALLPGPNVVLDIRSGRRSIISQKRKDQINKQINLFRQGVKSDLIGQGVAGGRADKILDLMVKGDTEAAQVEVDKINNDAMRRAFTSSVSKQAPTVTLPTVPAPARAAELEPTQPTVAETPLAPTVEPSIAVEAKPEAVEAPTITERIIEGPEPDTTDRDLLAERKAINQIPVKKRTPQQIERITAIEDELVARNADKFPDIDITPKTRNAEIKKVREQILADPVFQIRAEAAEELPDLSGSFNVDSQEIGDVKQRFEGRPELLKKFDLVEQGGRRWDSAAEELELGIDKLDEFMDIVELFVESKKPGAINPAALADALSDVKGTQQGTSLEIFALKEEMLTSGFTAAETNDAIVKHIKEEGLNPEDFKDDLVPLEEITDVETKRRILKALEKTTPKVKVRRTTDPEKIAIGKAQTRATKLKTPIFITETKFGVFTTSVNQPTSGDFIVVAPAAKGQLAGKVERVTDGKEGLTRAEIKAVGPGEAVELIKAQAKGEPVGFKAGQAESREKAKVEAQKIKAAEKLSGARRKTAADLVRAFTEKEDQGKFLLRVSQAKTPKDLTKIMTAVEKGIAKAEKRQSIKTLKTAAKAINPKKMLPEFAGIAQAIKNSLQLGKPQAEVIAKTAEIKAMAKQVLDNSREDSVAAIQAQRVLDEVNQKTSKTFAINQLSIEAIDQITDTLIALRFQNEADTIAAKDENATEAIRRRKLITESIVEIPDVPESLGGKGVRKFKGLHDNLESVLDAVAGARPGTYDLWIKSKNPTTQFIYDVLDAGVDQQILHSEKARDIMRDILDKNDVSKMDILNWSMRPEDVSKVRKAFDIAPKPVVHKFTLKNAKNVSTKFNFTTNEIMSIFMHSRNSYNLDVLLNDGLNRIVDGKKQKIRGFTVDIVDDMTDALTVQQKNVARQVGSRIMDGVNKEAGNKTSVKLEFFEILKVDRYWPANRSVIKGPKGKLPTGLTKTIESLAFLKERVGTGHPLKFAGFFETVHNVNKNMASYVGLAEPLREVKAVYTPDVIESLEDDNRGDQAKAITKLIERFEDPKLRVEGKIDEVVAEMLGGFAKAKLFLNVKLAPRQQLSSLLISAYVDPKFITEFKGVGTAELRAEIKALSPQFGARADGLQFDRDTGDAFVENELMNYLTGDTSAIDKTAIGMKFFDGNAIVDIYRAVKAEVEFHNPKLKVDSAEFKALLKDRFEWVARHTQPMWHPKDRSLLGSDPRPLVRSLTMFMSQREQMIRMVNNGIADFANSDKTAEDQVRLGKSLGAVAMNMVLFSIYNAAWAVLIQRRKKDVLDLLRDVFSDALSLPFFGGYFAKLFELMFNTFADKPTFHQFDFDDGPVVGIVQEILLEGIGGFARAGKHLVTGEKYKSGPNRGEFKWKNELLVATDALVDGFASLKGIPYHGAKDIVRSVKAQFTEKEKKAPRIE